MILGGEDQYYQPDDDDEYQPHPRHCWCDDCQDPDALRDTQDIYGTYYLHAADLEFPLTQETT